MYVLYRKGVYCLYWKIFNVGKKNDFYIFFLGNRCCEYIIGEGKYVLLKCS